MSALEDGRVTVDEFAEATQRLSRSIACAGLEVNLLTSGDLELAIERRRATALRRSWIAERRLFRFALAGGAVFACIATFCPFWWLHWAAWQIYTYQRYRDERRAFEQYRRCALELPAARLLKSSP